MAASRASREFHVVIYGATGFTGALVAEYFARNVDPSVVPWSLAGRSSSKLETVKKSLVGINERCTNIPLINASSDDDASMRSLAARTRVVLTTVGPYCLYGEPLVAACVEEGTDYCDITGETPWVREMIDKYGEQAERKGVKIVSTCGFDSIPADLGSLMMVDHIRKQHNQQTRSVVACATMKGGFSGGTFASIINLMDKPPSNMRDKFLLNPTNERPTTITSLSDDQTSPGFVAELNKHTAPFVMAAANTRVVRRSAALANRDKTTAYGDGFEYNESMGVKSMLQAWFVSIGLLIGVLLLLFRPTRYLLTKFGPKQGNGPSKELRSKSFFVYQLVAKSDATPPVVVTGKVAGGDPGYDETAKMLSECALCMACDRDQLPSTAGILTPATAMGLPLIERLRKAGLVLEVDQPRQ